MSESHPWRDKKRLQKLYCDKKMSLYEIADKLGCSHDTVYRWLDKHDVERRSFAESRKVVSGSKPAHFRTDRGYEKWTANYNGSQRTVLVHRLVAVAEHGVDVVEGNVVHHKNGVKWDNRPDNLKVMTDEEHKSHHAEQRDRVDGGVFK